MDDTQDGVTYGVQVSHTDGRWYIRYGWFDSLDRARENLPYAEQDFVSARIVRRTVTIEEVS